MPLDDANPLKTWGESLDPDLRQAVVYMGAEMMKQFTPKFWENANTETGRTAFTLVLRTAILMGMKYEMERAALERAPSDHVQ